MFCNCTCHHVSWFMVCISGIIYISWKGTTISKLWFCSFEYGSLHPHTSESWHNTYWRLNRSYRNHSKRSFTRDLYTSHCHLWSVFSVTPFPNLNPVVCFKKLSCFWVWSEGSFGVFSNQVVAANWLGFTCCYW